MRRSLLLIAFAFVFASSVRAQAQHSGWLASFNTVRINDKFSLHLDVQLRSTDELERVQTALVRPGINFHLNKSTTVTGGYAFVSNRRSVGGASALLGEHRAWEQLIYAHRFKRSSVAHRLRLEQRFIPTAVNTGDRVEGDGHDTAHRFRYFIRQIVPLTKREPFDKGMFFALQNEVFLNVGNKSAVNGRTFDQNRFYAAGGYRLRSKVDLEVGYLNQYSLTRSSFVNNHIVQFAVYKRL